MHRPCRRLVLPAVLCAGALVAAGPPPATAADDRHDTPTAKLIKGLHWREIGPYRGGRADAVTGLAGDRSTYYFGSTGGGVWKSVDAGRTWKNVSDGSFGGSIGAVAVSSWDPNVVYVGTGEVTVRGNVSEGDGVWKSVDAGKSWKHVGLEDSRHIVRLQIHPKNPDLVYAAVLGHLFGSNAMRGVYRSSDGGASWQRVLHVSDEVGAVDLAMDPVNPRILYAGMWRVRRTPWGFDSGGPGSGLWKSTDGGDHWTDLSQSSGMPAAPLGIVGVSVSRSNPDNIYAIVEAPEGGVFRSRDAGKTWTRTSSEHALRQRAWYYSRIYADPADPESVYVVNVAFLHSKDGGKTFSPIRSAHGDNHDLWIAPDEPQRMIECNDGGAIISENGGQSWTGEDNQPTAQIYRVTTDNAYPYRLLGAQQDNSSLRIAHRSWARGITRNDWQPTAGGESGYIAADPNDPDVVFGGSYGGQLIWLNHRTLEARDISPWPDNPMGAGAADLKHRFQWNFPFLISADGKTLYAGSQLLLRSVDRGESWQAISSDLTRNDKSKQGPSGGPITKDNTSIEYYDTRSPHPVGGQRRRAGAGEPRRRRQLEERHAARHARMDPGQQHRRQPLRSRWRLCRRHPLQARRRAPVPLQDQRLWGDLEAHRRRHRRHPLHPRGARRSRPKGAALCRHPARHRGLLRRRRSLAESAGQPAARSGHRSDHQGG
jgi:photosystem II stability/assembly factor-like uncharacterized protein